ncbi:MAG: hypothetical protein IKF19_00360 [Bacilli bacterium]|nr:hypothetical protein [Bacilli bacterium]
MAKNKKIVDITNEEKKSKDKYGTNSKGKIIKLEDNDDSKERAFKSRAIAIILWCLAIIFEIIGILRLTNVIKWFSNINITTFLVICIVLDLLFFIPGSLFWKKANHIDPASEVNKVKFWTINNLGVILSVLAFLPIIVVVLTDKELDKKSKTIVTAVAAIALIIAGVSSYDFNPISKEQLEKAEKEVVNVSGGKTVYWAPHSKKYHVDPDCPAFSQSETVFEGTVKQAFEKGLTDPCRRCIPELKENEEK